VLVVRCMRLARRQSLVLLNAYPTWLPGRANPVLAHSCLPLPPPPSGGLNRRVVKCRAALRCLFCSVWAQNTDIPLACQVRPIAQVGVRMGRPWNWATKQGPSIKYITFFTAIFAPPSQKEENFIFPMNTEQ